MPSRQVGSSGRNLLTFELELQDVEVVGEPVPSLLITTRWTPKEPQPLDPAAQLIVRYPSLELRYVPSRLAGRVLGSARERPPGRVQPRSIVDVKGIFNPGSAAPDEESIELGIAQLATEVTQGSPSWFASGFFEKTVTYRLPLDFAVLERVEQARLGKDFILNVIPRGEIQEVGYGSPSFYWLTDPTGVSLEFPRSRWGDILIAVGFPMLDAPLSFPVTGAPARAAQVHLREAMRLLNVEQIPDAVVNARKALEELRGVIPPVRPKKTDPDYREEDAATRIGRVSWAAYNLCNVKAHTKDPAEFSRAEALLVIQLAGAMINYAGAPDEARGILLASAPAIPESTVAADYAAVGNRSGEHG
jgi:hypothetical protein